MSELYRTGDSVTPGEVTPDKPEPGAVGDTGHEARVEAALAREDAMPTREESAAASWGSDLPDSADEADPDIEYDARTEAILAREDGMPDRQESARATWGDTADGPDTPAESSLTAEQAAQDARSGTGPLTTATDQTDTSSIAGDTSKASDLLDRQDRPPPLDKTRPYDRAGGLAKESEHDQRILEAHAREATPRDAEGGSEHFPDPDKPWLKFVNDDGPEASPFRANNCLDCSLSAISTWHGEPKVAAPRMTEFKPDGKPSTDGETDGIARAERWLGHNYEHAGDADVGFTTIRDKLHNGGHGSATAIVSSWKTGGTHAWNAFNYNGEIVWVDPQRGARDRQPLYRDHTAQVWAIAIDREGNRL
jgi:hypothetical protein